MDKDRFGKYCYKLLNNMNEERIGGSMFLELTVDDLNCLGISDINDRLNLFNHIQTLRQ